MSYLKLTTKMGTWCRRRIQKGARGSQESGRKKGLVPPTWARNCAKASRAYKNNPRYEDWCLKCNGEKVKWGTT